MSTSSKTPPPKLRSLADLKSVQKALHTQAQQREQARQQAEILHKQQAAEQRLFERAVGVITKMTPRATATVRTVSPPAPALSRGSKAEAELCDPTEDAGALWSDELDTRNRLLSADPLSYVVPGRPRQLVQQLQRGHWPVQAHIDLHGLRRDAARQKLAQFLAQANDQGLRCLRVVHGVGYSSAGGDAVLKRLVPSWLTQTPLVQAFAQAPAADGGAGALWVLLIGG